MWGGILKNHSAPRSACRRLLDENEIRITVFYPGFNISRGCPDAVASGVVVTESLIQGWRDPDVNIGVLLEIPNIAIYQVSGGFLSKFSIKFGGNRLSGRSESSQDFHFLNSLLWNYHFVVKKVVNCTDLGSFGIIGCKAMFINGLLEMLGSYFRKSEDSLS